MDLWQRVLALFVVVVVAVLVLRLLPGPVVLILFVGALVYVSTTLTRQARRERSSASDVLGLRAEPVDPFGILGHPFALLRRGSDGTITDLMHGRWGALEVKVFDLSYRPSVAAAGVPEERRFTCALADARSEGPTLVVEPEAFLTPAQDRADLPEIEVGVDRFDQAFDIRTADAAAARAALHEGLTAWLVAEDERWAFERSGRLVLLYTTALSSGQRPDVLDAMKELLDLIAATTSEQQARSTPSTDPA